MMSKSSLLYWSTVIDFIELFQDIKYKDIPLALVFWFGLSDDIEEELMLPDYPLYINNRILTDDKVQPYFDRYINSIKGPCQKGPNKGKIIFLNNLLYFPNNILEKYFAPSIANMFVVTKRYKANLTDIAGIPVVQVLSGFQNYYPELKELAKQFQDKAYDIIFNTEQPVFRKPGIINRFIDKIPLMLELIERFDNYFDQIAVSCVIVGTTGGDYPLARILSLLAAKRGIPSICMQHGLNITGEFSFLPVFTSKLAVYGYWEKEWYLNRGVNEEKIEIIGHPRFDNIFIERHMATTDFKKKFRLDPEKKSILIITQPVENNLGNWDQFLNALPLQFEVLIRPHPKEVRQKSCDRYKYFSTRYKSVKLINDLDLYDILPNVDIVVVNSSTVGLEAMLFNKPVFILSEEHNENYNYYYEKLDNLAYCDALILPSVINKLFSDNDFNKYVELTRERFLTYHYPNKTSTNLLIELINKLV